MKLAQGQIWKRDEEYFRVDELEKLAVAYKLLRDPGSKDGTHHHATKKEFCRLLKNAVLVSPIIEPFPSDSIRPIASPKPGNSP